MRSAQNGKRVTSVSHGDTHVQYANLGLDDLLKLRSQIKSGIENGVLNNHKRQVIFSTSKGRAMIKIADLYAGIRGIRLGVEQALEKKMLSCTYK